MTNLELINKNYDRNVRIGINSGKPFTLTFGEYLEMQWKGYLEACKRIEIEPLNKADWEKQGDSALKSLSQGINK